MTSDVCAQASISQRRPCERRDPYAVQPAFKDAVRGLFAQHNVLWLWVPAFAGTTMLRHTFAISRRDTPELCLYFPPSKHRGRRECRTPGASAAARVLVVSTRVSHHGHTGNTRHSPRNGFNGFLRALPGDRAFCHRRLADTSTRLERQRRGVRTTRLRRPQVGALVSSTICVHRIPHPTSVTIAIRPSEGARPRIFTIDFSHGKSGIF